ncbi:MAG: sigma-70 family RNA polymerase sigma factor [Phycisphaerae bacterium]|nr:sigma-70 family RNA polymerase sigma factor [Phycisphaerae bacterium]
MSDPQEGIENLVTQEIKEVVSAAMKSLKTSHRAVLVMRCYDGLSYAEIAQAMGCTEFGGRMLFLRAKKALERQLARNGLKRGSLLGALVLFGQMTAPSEAVAAQVTVGAAAVDVGLAATLAGLATSKAAVVSLAAAGAVSLGVTVGPDLLGPRDQGPIANPAAQSYVASLLGARIDQPEKHWYFLPEGPGGPLLLRAQADQGLIVLQNAVANYAFDGQTLRIQNHRCWPADLSVTRLPTDNPAMREFLDRVEGRPALVPSTRATGRGLLVQVAYDKVNGTARPEVFRNPNVSDEDYFQSDWPMDVVQDDRRDEMHKRGWTFFRIEGQVRGQAVSGQGRLPFVYQSYQRLRPWLQLKVGDLVVQDNLDGRARLALDGGGQSVFPAGSFFQGLPRPWEGLHTVDVVRRDAAEQEVWFKTTPGPRAGQVQVDVDLSTSLRAVYTIDLDTDVVDRIDFLQGDQSVGRLVFTYLQDITGLGRQFSPPQTRLAQGPQGQHMGLLWLGRLADGSLGQP